MWMVIADLRAYEITGDVTFRSQAKLAFRQGLRSSLESRPGRRPVVVDGARLQERLPQRARGDRRRGDVRGIPRRFVLRKAKAFTGGRRTRCSTATAAPSTTEPSRPAKPSPRIPRTTRTTRVRSSARRGSSTRPRTTRVYYHDAVKALGYTKANLRSNGGPQERGSGRDGGGFSKASSRRWATKFTRDNHITGYDGGSRATRTPPGVTATPHRQ